MDICQEGGALATTMMVKQGGTALCGEVMQAEAEHYAEFTPIFHRIIDQLDAEYCYDDHGAWFGVVRSTHVPGQGPGGGLGLGKSTMDGWMLSGAYMDYIQFNRGKGCNHNPWVSDTDGIKRCRERVRVGETVGLLLRAGRLSVYRGGACVGVMCEGLSGPLVWAVLVGECWRRILRGVRIVRAPPPQ
eukprot:COSAG02_NODE_4620_length_5156_cov_2.045284_4_plen_188_part_00